MDFLVKYKKIIIVGIIVSTIIALVVYYLVRNDDDYEDFEENILQENNVDITKEKNIIIDEVSKIKVHVSGEVLSPGVVEIEEGARIIDAINMAGGLSEEADISKINLAYIVEDATKINIPNINDIEENEIITIKDNDFESSEDSKVMININTASVEELQKLEGIGSSIALRIVAYRKENGKFNSIDDLRNISGIGDSKFEKIKDNIYVK